MSYTVEKISSNKVKIVLSVSAETFEEARKKAYLKARGSINVPGFRKGKAPRSFIENLYGKTIFDEDAIEIAFPDAYDEAIKGDDIQVVSRPELSDSKYLDEGGIELTIEVFVRPEVTLGQYKGVAVHKHVHPVTEEEIDRRIQEDVRTSTTTQDADADHAVAEGDVVNLDYAGSVDGVPFDGGTAEGQTLTIGSKAFIPGFEEQLIGMKIGEEHDIGVTFPEEYHAEELKGKPAVFHVKINGIQIKLVPELDDEFAADVSEFETFAEYKADIERKLTEDRRKAEDNQAENAAIKAAADNAQMDIPDAMIDQQIDYRIQELRYRIMYQYGGMSLEDYMKYSGMTMDALRDMYREDAVQQVRAELTLDAIRAAEGIEASEDEIEDVMRKAAEDRQQGFDEFKAEMKDEARAMYADRAAIIKTVKLLMDNAQIELCEGDEHDHEHHHDHDHDHEDEHDQDDGETAEE